MEFADIAVGIQRKLGRLLFSTLYFTITEGNLDPAIFRYYLIQDAYYLKSFFRSLSPLG